MRNRAALVIVLAACVLAPTGARAQDAGVVGTKLVIVDKLVSTSKAKTVFVTKGDPGIAKGVEGDPALLEGTLEVFYTDEPTSVVGSFLIPSPWQVNKATVAKYVNKLAPTGGEVKVAVVKPGSVAKVVAKGLGDGQAIDLSTAPGPGGVSVVFSINNGNDFSMHRLCTRFSTGDGSTIVYKSIAGGTGYKLVAKMGVGATCPATPFETVTIPSDAEPAETPGSPSVVVTNPNLVTQFGSASFSLNNATYTRYHREGVTGQPDAILVLVPGFEGGATSFKILAENLIHRARTTAGLALEVWAFDRRGQQLEDRAGMVIASGLDDELVALDWFFGGELGLPLSPALVSGPNRRAIFHNASSDVAFMANWTSLTFSRDIDAVVEAARAAAANQNVFLGGHSAGTGFTARYAATDFDLTGFGPAEPGYAKVRGLVLLEGGGSGIATPLTGAQLDQIEDKADGGLFYAVRDQAPRCVDGTDCSANGNADCVGLGQGTCTAPTGAYAVVPGLLNPRILAAVEPGSIQARTDPDTGQVILQVDQGSGTAIGTVPDLATLGLLPQATASAALGSFLDDDGLVASIASFVRTSVGAPGAVVGPLLTWQDIREGAMPASVIPDNGPAPTALPGTVWGQEYEVTDLTRMQEIFVADETNFTDWYYPQAGLSVTTGVGIDSTALSVGRGRRDIENLTQAANVDVPVISFGGTNGLTPVPGSFTAFGQALGVCTAPSCDGSTPRVIDASTPNPAFPTFGGVNGGYEIHLSDGFSHLDIVAAQDGPRSNVVAPLIDFLVRNIQ